MGTLENFDLNGFDNFIETGTGLGEGLVHAKKYPFKHLYSFEIHQGIFDKSDFLNDQRTTVLNCDSVTGLKGVLPNIGGKNFYWLDAHYPGADFGYAPYGTGLPLYDELTVINEFKKEGDVILIDDVRIYDKDVIRAFLPDVKFFDLDEGYGISGGEPKWLP